MDMRKMLLQNTSVGPWYDATVDIVSRHCQSTLSVVPGAEPDTHRPREK